MLMTMVEAQLSVTMDNCGGIDSDTGAGIGDHCGSGDGVGGGVVAVFTVKLAMTTGSGSWAPGL